MNSIDISIISLSKSFGFSLNSNNDFNTLWDSLMYLFLATSKEDGMIVESLQHKDQNFENRLKEFVDKFKISDPKINRIKTYFDVIKTDSYFFVIFNKEVPKEISFKMCNFLLAQEEGKDYLVFEEEMKESFGKLKDKYDISIFGFQEKSYIGESDKIKRICRFCKKSASETTFRKIAHSISEALGNKLIVTNDECDICNHEFGTGIENDLIFYVDFYRNFFGVKGKNGIPTLRGENYVIRNEGENRIKLEHHLKEGEEPNNEFKFTLNNHGNITYLNIYKTLVKYALSVLDPNHISVFEETIAWIRGKQTLVNLPKVAILQNYQLYKDHPMLTLYQRKDEDNSLPLLVCEFRFTFLVFVFIVPEKETNIYTEEFYDRFWNFFNHYKDLEGWQFRKFTNPNPVKFNIKLNFTKADK